MEGSTPDWADTEDYATLEEVFAVADLRTRPAGSRSRRSPGHGSHAGPADRTDAQPHHRVDRRGGRRAVRRCHRRDLGQRSHGSPAAEHPSDRPFPRAGPPRRAADGPHPGGRRSRRLRRRGLHWRVQPGRRRHAARRRLRPGSGCHGRQRGRSAGRRCSHRCPHGREPRTDHHHHHDHHHDHDADHDADQLDDDHHETTDHHDDSSEHARRGWDSGQRGHGKATDRATERQRTGQRTRQRTRQRTGQGRGQRPRGRTRRPQPRRQPGPWVRRELAAARSAELPTARRARPAALPLSTPRRCQPGATGAPGDGPGW